MSITKTYVEENFGILTDDDLYLDAVLVKPVNLTDENPAVAELMAHAAISVNSQFFYNGTGAYDNDARDALVEYFNYDENAQFLWRTSYQGDWNALLKSELDAGRPVIYGGVDQSNMAGHTFIFDGYQDDFFHVNWGWGGQYNGYFYLDTLDPASYHYNYQHDAIVGIQPNIDLPVELYPPENFTASVDGNDVELNWQSPSVQSSLELLGYNVYRNDSLLNSKISTAAHYKDSDVPQGNQTYTLQAVFSGSGEGMKVNTEAYISGITDEKTINFELYPNPVNDVLRIKIISQAEILQVWIQNLGGQTLWQWTPTHSAENITIDLSDLKTGVYLISIQSATGIFSKKLLKF